jgi:hypothetical protein
METLIKIYKSSPHTSLDHTNENDPQKTDEHHKYELIRIEKFHYFIFVLLKRKTS